MCVYGKPIPELYGGASPAIWDHTVFTVYLPSDTGERVRPALTPGRQVGRPAARFIRLGGIEG